jgi:ADP-ribose pyrophosphatase YjhB (NUDIX family)
MNVIFAASLWVGENGTGSGQGTGWADELPALARRNRLLLWEDVAASDLNALPVEILSFFQGNRLAGPSGSILSASVREMGLTLDETALVGASPACREAAREAALPCFYLTRNAGEKGENLYASVDAVVDAVWKVNTVERHLFPIVTVGGLLVDDGGDALFVRTRKWSGKWGIPGGKVDYGETLEAAFRRETLEETGLVVGEATLAMTQEAVEHPEFFRKRHFVLVNFFGRVPGRHPAVRLNHEGAEYFWAPPGAAPASTERPLNGPTQALVARYLQASKEGGPSWAF